MEFAIRDRGQGKTHLAVEWLKAGTGKPGGKRVLVTFSEESAAAVRRQYGLSDKQVMSYRSAQLHLRGRSGVEVAVDDLDCMLGGLLGIGPLPIGLVTATGVLSRESVEA